MQLGTLENTIKPSSLIKTITAGLLILFQDNLAERNESTNQRNQTDTEI